MRTPSFLKRAAAGAIVLAVVGAATLLTGGVASAQTNPIGTLTFSPPSGLDVSAPTVTTSAACPAASNAYHIRLQGPNGLDNLATARGTAGFSTSTPFSVAFTNSFKDVAALNSPPTTIVAGNYTVSLNCVSGLTGGTVQASFVSTVTFTSPTAYTTAPAGPTATTTSLGVTPASPITAGTASTLTATVSPAAATGTVQFFNGATAVGAPVAVSGGTASTTTTLPTGSNSLTAAFTAGAGYANSTSPAVTYQVNPAPGAVTTTVLTATPTSPQNAGTPVTLNAAVSSATAGTVTGSVQFSDAGSPLGSPVTLTGGAASFTTSTLSVGNHALVATFTSATPAQFANSSSGTVTFNIVGLVAPAFEDITTTVNAGALTITVATRQVVLPSPVLLADASRLATSGRLNPITVSDTRAGNPGWTASGQVGDFTSAGGALINGGNLGWSPGVIGAQTPSQVVTAGPVVNPALAIAPGATPPAGLGLASSRQLASAAPGFGTGTASLDAGLALNVPTSTTAGTYTALLTLTAI